MTTRLTAIKVAMLAFSTTSIAAASNAARDVVWRPEIAAIELACGPIPTGGSSKETKGGAGFSLDLSKLLKGFVDAGVTLDLSKTKSFWQGPRQQDFASVYATRASCAQHVFDRVLTRGQVINIRSGRRLPPPVNSS